MFFPTLTNRFALIYWLKKNYLEIYSTEYNNKSFFLILYVRWRLIRLCLHESILEGALTDDVERRTNFICRERNLRFGSFTIAAFVNYE